MNGMNRYQHARSFVLLEVIISLVILTVTVSTVLKGFSISLRSSKHDKLITMGSFLAQYVLSDLEIDPFEEGSNEGNFGEEYPDFFYKTNIEKIDVEYEDLIHETMMKELRPLYMVQIEILYDDGRGELTRIVDLASYITEIEKFTYRSKRENRVY